MSDTIWFAYAPVAVIVALYWARRFSAHEPVKWPQVWLYASIAFTTHFFLPFYVLGLIELVLEKPVVHPLSALSLCLAMFGIGWLIWGRAAGSSKAGEKIPYSLVAREPQLQDLAQTKSLERVSRIVLSLTAAAFAVTGSMIAFGFPRGFEPMAYHLPIGVHIFQTGSLKVWDHEYVHTFPANASIWYGYWLALGFERVATVSNLAFLLPLSAGLWQIGRVLGASRGAQCITLAGFVTIPIVAFSALESGADIGGIAWLACALALALESPALDFRRITMIGLCLGLAYGFKALHLISAVVIALWLVYSELRRTGTRMPVIPGKRPAIAAILKTQATLALAFLGMGGFWLVRNWMELGNPFYPIQLPLLGQIAGWTAAPDFSLSERTSTQLEWVRSSAEWWVYPWVEWHYIDQNFKHSSGLGPFVASVVLVAVLATLLTLRSQGYSAADRRAFLLLGGFAIITAWAVLGDRQPRYLMGVLVFWVPLVGWYLTSLPTRWASLQFGVAAVSVLAMLGVLLTKQAVEFGRLFVLAKQTARWEVYEYPHELDGLPVNSVIMNLVERTWNYPLYGDRLSLKVINYLAAGHLAAASRYAKDDTPVEFDFDVDVLRTAGITHMFALDSTAIKITGCASLRAIGSSDGQPSNENPVHPAPVLYELAYNGKTPDCKGAAVH